MNIILNILLLIAGFWLLIKGADWLVEGAGGLAAKLGIPKLVVGLTIVAMGTSAPEAAVSITSSLRGSADIAVGNVLGSNILNVLVILGITSCIVPLPLKKTTIRYELPFMIAVSILYPIIGLQNNLIGFKGGIILWVLFLAYLSYLYYMTKKGFIVEEEEEFNNDYKIPMLLFLTVLGIGVIIGGSNLAVEAASSLAKIFGISERIIGLTIVALGTSLPELVTSVTAARKGSVDIAVGNIVGSNLFNTLFVIGTSALITNVPYQQKFFVDSIVAIYSAVLLLVLVLNKDQKLKRWGGIIMLISYLAYFVYLML